MKLNLGCGYGKLDGWDPRYADAVARGRIGEGQLDEMARSYNNVTRESVITLEAIGA
jgi:hypothetical protein